MALSLNLTGKEASSKALEPIPSGWYKVTISDVEMKEVKNPPKPGKKDNRGEPFYSIEHTVAEGPHEGRKVFTNVMLFEGALYTAVQLVYGITGVQPEEGKLEVPDADELLGVELYAKVKIAPKRVVDGVEYEPKNEVAGYKPLSAGDVKLGSAGKTNSLLPS
jgi:hypothetical protein